VSVDQITEPKVVESPESDSHPSHLSRFVPSRRSMLKWLLVGIVTGCGFVWLLSWWSPVPVREVTVVGASDDSVGAIMKAAGSVEGQALRDVEVDEIAARVLRLPGIQGVDLEIQRPWTVAVVVDERHAIAQVKSAGSYVVVDSAGDTIRIVKKRMERLPLLKGEPGPLATAVEVLNQLPHSISRRLESVSTGDDRRTSITLRSGMVIELGAADSVARKLEVARSLLGYNPSSINVSVPERPAVTGQLKLPRKNQELSD
jgi:cell division protein FtsQ